MRGGWNTQVLLAMAMTVLGFGGVFAAITCIAPMMTHVAGFTDGSVTWLLVLFGVGMVGGNLVGGRYADRALMPLLYVSLGALAVVLALFTVTAHHKVLAAVTIALIGALGFATVPPLQKRVLDQAHGAPTPASAVNIGAFNLGNALSAWLGGMVIAAGLGCTAPTGSAPLSPPAPCSSPSCRLPWSGAPVDAVQSSPATRLSGSRQRSAGDPGRAARDRSRRVFRQPVCASLAAGPQPAATVRGAKRRFQSPGSSGIP